MSIEHTCAIMDAACAIPGVREKLPAEWWQPNCAKCGWQLDTFTRCADPNCAAIESRKKGERHFCGPDFADERNLWALLRVCDAVFDCPVNIMWRGTTEGENLFALHGRQEGRFTEGHGLINRTIACLAALSAALGIPND